MTNILAFFFRGNILAISYILIIYEN